MKEWKRVLGLTAMFAAMAMFSFAAPAEQGRGGGRAGAGAGGEGRAKQMKEAATIVAKFVAKEVGLNADKVDKFVAAYVAEQEAATKRMMEALKAGGGGGGDAFLKLNQENQKAMQAMLKANLTEEQAKKAVELIGMGGLDRTVATWLGAGLEEAKINQALPALAKYNKAAAELMQKMRGKQGAGGEEMRAEMQKLREATAKELAPIIGEELATKFRESRFTGFGGGRGGAGTGGEGRRRGGEGGGAAPKAK